MTYRLPVFRKANAASNGKRFRSIHPKTGEVYEITRSKGEGVYCLSIDGEPMSWTRDKTELVKTARRHAAKRLEAA